VGDSPWALRAALIVIGLVVVAAIYILGVMRCRSRNRHYPGRMKSWRPAATEEAFDGDSALDRDPTDDDIIAVRVRKVEPLADLPVIRNDAAEARAAAPPMIDEASPSERPARGRRSRAKSAQLDLGFGDSDGSRQRDTPPPEPAILTLYLRPAQGSNFAGPAIVRNVNAVGMRHGELQIFHHFGAGDLRTERALFSLANMFEPGSFDLQRIEAFQTAGLVMFLNLPAALDGPVAFELFLNTAQRLAEGLQAELMSDPGTSLHSASIEKMRRTAALFAEHV